MNCGRLVIIIFFSLLTAFFVERFFVRDLLLQYRSMDLDVKGKTVLVTGASTGIGEQTAYRFAELGARIVITARRKKTLEQVAAKCRSLGSPEVSIIPADMSVPAEVDAVSAHVLKHFKGQIDYVILNHVAGIQYALYDNKPQNNQFLMQVNYISYVQIATALMPHLEASHGSLVVVSSVAGRMRVGFSTAYAATKFALEGFFTSWRREMQIRRCNASISMLPFGLIGTDNAINAVQDKVVGLRFESKADAGLAVVRVAVTKPKDHFWPWWGRLVVLFSHLAPDLLDNTENLMLNYTRIEPFIKSSNARDKEIRSKFMKELGKKDSK